MHPALPPIWQESESISSIYREESKIAIVIYLNISFRHLIIRYSLNDIYSNKNDIENLI